MSYFVNTNRDQMKANQTKKITLGIPNGVNVMIRPAKVQEAVCCLELDEVCNKLQRSFI